MIFYILVVIAILLSLIAFKQEGFIGLIPVAMISFLVAGGFAFIASAGLSSCNLDATRIETWSTKLESLRNGGLQMEGSFFLASGWIGSSESYVYMYRTENGDLRRGRQDAYHCTIRERDGETPRRMYDRRFIRIPWLVPWELRMKDSMPVFVVPPGTVISLNTFEIE